MQALRGLAGEGLTRALHLPFPGPVIGLLLLLLVLQIPALRAPVAAIAEQLLAHLSLLFVPVGVGVVVHLGVLSDYAWQLLLIIAVSTWAGMAATAWVTHKLMRDREGEPHA
jgi:holin-like protein